MSGDKILVTGATGFLGRHLVAHLVEQGYAVRALVREASDTAHLAALGVELFTGDVRESASVNAAIAGCRYVVHGAGLFRFWGQVRDFERTNAEGAAYVLEAALRHNVAKLVHISTVVVVGTPPPGQTIDEATPCQPADPYQRSKLDGENLVRMFHKTARLPAVILRPGAFYGPYGRYAFNRLFFEDPLKGLLIQVHWGKRLTFPVFVPDVARAVVAALKDGRPGEVYNISGAPLPHRQVNSSVSRLAGVPGFRLNVPARCMLALAGWMTRQSERTGREPYYPLTLASYVFNDWPVSSAKAQAELGFRPTPFEEGARQTLEWYASTGLFRTRVRPARATSTSSPG
jgi:dihydroflavonol-4-reductase